MIDISDGLSSDLNHICAESDVGALVESAKIPIDGFVTELCGRRALDPLLLALHGGEDFELLFTVKPENVSRLPKRVDGVSVTRVGEITKSADGVRISEGSRVWNLEPGGWKHF
jgi:thiamine-monophosphate kinase